MSSPAPTADLAPPVALSPGPLGVVQAADREIARLTAVRARAVAEFAATRPASADRAQGEPGAMSAERWVGRPELLRSVSEWAAQELSVALSISTTTAETLLERSLALVDRLPGTLAALEAGALHAGHLHPLLERVAPIADGTVRGKVESGLLSWASGRVTTPAQLGARARREVLKHDARAAARDLETAVASRGVSWRPDRAEGMAAVTAALLLPEAAALVAALGAHADALEDEPGAPKRTRGQKMADCLLDLVLRPGEHDLQPVQIALTLVAPVSTAVGGDAPGEVDGEPVPAEVVRGLLHALAGTHTAAAGDSYDDRTDPSVDVGARVDAGELAWQAAIDREFARASEALERRILAGELDDPDPITDADLAAWTARWDGEAHQDRLEQNTGERPGPSQPASPPESPPGSPPGSSPGSSPGPPPGPPPESPSGSAAARPAEPPEAADGPRWAEADRAVDDAGAALLHAQRAVGRATELVRTAAVVDGCDETAWRNGPGGRVTAAEDALTVLLAAADTARQTLGHLLERTAGGGLVDRPRIALTDAVTGALLALTDLPGLRRAAHCGARRCRRRPASCAHDLSGRPGLGPPPPTDGYRPGAELDRFLRGRDRRCRFPGCRRRVPRGGELDHDTAYPGGPTSAANLVGYCTANHRGKHQAPGWRHELADDATLTVTTPTGLVAVTTPPPY